LRDALAAAAVAALLAAAAPARAATDPAAEADPLAGTAPPGFVFPGAVVPFGMVQNSPDTTGQFAYGGYDYTDAAIRGFSLVHVSGPGVKKGGDLPFMPTVGPAGDDPDVYASPFTHAREHAEPGYYRVTLDASQTDVELTASEHAAMQRYTFAPSPSAKVIMDAARSGEGTAPATWRVSGPDEVAGSRRGRYPVFFVARFSRPFASHGAFAGGGGGWVGFDTTTDRAVTVRIGLSFVDEDGARRNLDAEAPSTRSFEAMRAAARAAWSRELGKVRLEGGAPTDRRAFYTALYRASLHPNVFTDVDGRYRGQDDAVHTAVGRTQYANFSLWDTYKGENQWLALTSRERYRDMLTSLLADAREGGKLPRWGEQSIDPAHMSGDPAVPMIADGVCRGVLDPTTAEDLYAQAVALRDRRPPELDRLGYLPDRPGTTLEYGVADFSLALMAHALGHDADAQRWLRASLDYRNVLDPQTRWIRPRAADGSWYAGFDPALDETGFQEGNSWQYSWLAPHDARGLFDRMGGDAAVRDRLDTFFKLPPEAQNRATLFGLVYRLPQYAPGNEHDLQAPWMPVFAGEPWKGAEAQRAIQSLFRDTPDGLPGNDDLGGLSGWAVWSMLGLGPVTPGAPFEVIGSPLFPRATIDVGAGRRAAIRAPGASALSRYVTGARLDGAALPRAWVEDARLRAGGLLELAMSPTPDKGWGAAPGRRPPSASDSPLAGFGCDVTG
jgi:predicted alpha-1,2-mannosidase